MEAVDEMLLAYATNVTVSEWGHFAREALTRSPTVKSQPSQSITAEPSVATVTTAGGGGRK